MALLRVCKVYAFVAFVAFIGAAAAQARNYTEIAFYDVQHTDDSVVANRGPSLRLFSSPDARTCWNLPDVFSNNRTAGNMTREGSTLFTLDNITYTRSEGSYDASLSYTQWYVNQYPIDGDGNTSAPMQVNVYSESNCNNDTHPYFANSCRQSAGGHLGDWGARSISLQPNNAQAGPCLYNATNGAPGSLGSADESGAAGGVCLNTFVLGAAIAMGIATVL